jgi:cytochrome bd-type quinol oxidase subunit 2
MNFKKWKSNTYIFLGFTIFDLFHITFAIYFLIHAYQEQGQEFQKEMSESLVEIACSVLLMVFIVALTRTMHDEEERNQCYSFAWVVASMSLMLPFSFELPSLLSGGYSNSPSYFLTLSCLLLSSFSFLAFIISVFLAKDNHKRRIWVYLGIAAFFSLVPLAIINTCFNKEEVADQAWFVCSIIRHLAPLFPVGFGLVSLHKEIAEKATI